MLCLWTLIAEHYSRPFGDYRIAKTCTLWESISLRYNPAIQNNSLLFLHIEYHALYLTCTISYHSRY